MRLNFVSSILCCCVRDGGRRPGIGPALCPDRYTMRIVRLAGRTGERAVTGQQLAAQRLGEGGSEHSAERSSNAFLTPDNEVQELGHDPLVRILLQIVASILDPCYLSVREGREPGLVHHLRGERRVLHRPYDPDRL